MNLLSYVVPAWMRLVAVAVIAGAMFLLGQLHGERVAGEFHNDYITKQAAQTVAIGKAQTKVVVQTETKFADRIKKIYIQGETIEKQVPVFIDADDNAACSISLGFVRIHDAAWAGDDPGSAAQSDREPSRVSIAEVAETTAANATTCRAWREKAIGLEEFYEKLKTATNGP